MQGPDPSRPPRNDDPTLTDVPWPPPAGPTQVGTPPVGLPPVGAPFRPGPQGGAPQVWAAPQPPGGPLPSWPGPPPVGPWGSGGRRSRRGPWWIVGAVLGVLVLMAGAAAGGYLLWQPARPVAAAPEAAPSVVGDEATADPCGAVSDEAFERFGTVVRYSDFGELAGCRIEVTSTAQETVRVDVALRSAAEAERTMGTRERVGGLEIRRPTGDATDCSRLVMLPDRRGIGLTVSRAAAGTIDLCAVADAATSSVALVVGAGGLLPRRTLEAPTDGLAAIDTCALLDAPALGGVPGLDVTTSERGFAGWTCVWGDAALAPTGPQVVVFPWRYGPPTAEDAALRGSVDGRDAYTSEYGTAGFCQTRVVLADYVGSTGNQRNDVLIVQVDNVPTDPCGQVRRLAQLAVERLPPR